MTTENASQQAVSSSILARSLLGFHPASLEERFQQEQVKRAKTTDLLANAVFSVLCSALAWNLLHHPSLPRGVFGRSVWVWLLVMQPLLLQCLWLVWSLHANLQTRWRRALIVATRLQVVTAHFLSEEIVVRRYLNGEGLVVFVTNAVLTSQVISFCISGFSRSFKLPFRFHLPLELIKAAILLRRTSSICRSCSSDMKERYSALSHVLGRALTGAAVLQTDSEFSVPRRDAACTAVSTFLMLSVVSMTSTLLGYRETWSRYKFLVSHASQPGEGLSLLQMGTNLSLLPVFFVMLAIPALSLLWILVATLSSMD